MGVMLDAALWLEEGTAPLKPWVENDYKGLVARIE